MGGTTTCRPAALEMARTFELECIVHMCTSVMKPLAALVLAFLLAGCEHWHNPFVGPPVKPGATGATGGTSIFVFDGYGKRAAPVYGVVSPGSGGTSTIFLLDGYDYQAPPAGFATPGTRGGACVSSGSSVICY